MDMGVFKQKEQKIPGAHKIGAGIFGPRIAGGQITEMRLSSASHIAIILFEVGTLVAVGRTQVHPHVQRELWSNVMGVFIRGPRMGGWIRRGSIWRFWIAPIVSSKLSCP